MAKELPYFKFEPNQWENGNIQMVTREDKGLFIDLCSMYWSRVGDLPLKLAVQKLCGGNATALESLSNEKIIAIEDDKIIIQFLDEQLSEFEDASEKNRRNALSGWEKRRKTQKNTSNAVASKSHSETDAIREDKIREEEIINSVLSKSEKFPEPSKAKKKLVVSEELAKGLGKVTCEMFGVNEITNARMFMDIHNFVNDQATDAGRFEYLKSQTYWYKKLLEGGWPICNPRKWIEQKWNEQDYKQLWSSNNNSKFGNKKEKATTRTY